MAIYDVEYLGKRDVAEGTTEFRFSKPVGHSYRAGQFLDILLKATPGADKMSHVHGFSFVSSPFEDHLAVATRMRDTPFKNAMRDLPDHTPVQIDANFGDFVLHKNEAMPAVYLAGGIGVTPARSAIAQATHDHSAHDITLFYVNRDSSRAAYAEDFKAFAKTNPHFHYVPVYSRGAGGEVGAESGHLSAETIRRHVADIARPKWYVSGPEAFVRATRALLVELGADEDNLRTEEFEGY